MDQPREPQRFSLSNRRITKPPSPRTSWQINFSRRFIPMKMWLAALAVIFLWCGGARAQAPFYQGKTITIVVGTKAGDDYDPYSPMLRPYMTKNIPRNPQTIIPN